MSPATLQPEQALAAGHSGPLWFSPADFELGLLTEDGHGFGTVPLGPRDFLASAHCTLWDATAAGVVPPGGVCRVAGLQAAELPNGRGELAVREWYLALTLPTGELAAIRRFDITPFAPRACREALARGRDPTKTMFTLMRRRGPTGRRLGPMTVAADIPSGPVPDLSHLTVVGSAPLTIEPVYIWPESLLRRFARFALAHPKVEVLAAVVGRPFWAQVKGSWRILVVTVREIVPVPLELTASTAASVSLTGPVAEYVRRARSELESRAGERLYDLGTLHPHLPVEQTADDAQPAGGAAVQGAAAGFCSISDVGAMFTKYFLPYQTAMIWNVPEDRSECTGRALAAQFQQWCWSSTGTIAASSGFYLEEGK